MRTAYEPVMKRAPAIRNVLADPAVRTVTGLAFLVLFGAGLLIGVGARTAGGRTAGGRTAGHGLTGSVIASPASIVSMMTIKASAISRARECPS